MNKLFSSFKIKKKLNRKIFVFEHYTLTNLTGSSICSLNVILTDETGHKLNLDLYCRATAILCLIVSVLMIQVDT